METEFHSHDGPNERMSLAVSKLRLTDAPRRRMAWLNRWFAEAPATAKSSEDFAADTGTGAHYCASMFGMRTGAAPLRVIWAALFALLLALRMLSPPGFMPAFDHGAVTIVACPDSEAALLPAGSMHHHHHDHDKAKHQSPCPYASASALGALGQNFESLLDVLIVGAALLLGRTFLFIERHGRRERPPLRGPPLLV